MAWIVVCEDGVVRHDGDFVHLPDAEQYATWEHFCTASHRIITRDQYLAEKMTGTVA